jgi:hypothetical protein
MMQGSKRHYVDHAPYSSASLIIRQMDSKNLETPFERVDSYLTPTELFYIRSHYPTPNLDAASYLLGIRGAVGRLLSLSYEELRNMRTETRATTVECAGNSRVFLVPQVQGAQWELSLAGKAEWTGVPLGAAGARRPGGRCLRDRARRSRSPAAPGVAHLHSIDVARDLGIKGEVRAGVQPGDQMRPMVDLADGSRVQVQASSTEVSQK